MSSPNSYDLTCKIARKTAGNYFLRKGFSIEGVSGTLGHTSIAMTEAHYVKVTGGVVNREAGRLAQLRGVQLGNTDVSQPIWLLPAS